MFKIIVAHDPNRLIGNGLLIPWHIKEDFLHFKRTTLNHTLIMGSNTFKSIGKPLPNRKTIVATIKDFKYDHEDVTISNDLFEVLRKYKESEEELVVCGGATIYKLALPYVDKMVISEVKKEYQGDACFPSFEEDFILESIEEKEEFIIKIYRRK
jgi:dihydrofolate reductase